MRHYVINIKGNKYQINVSNADRARLRARVSHKAKNKSLIDDSSYRTVLNFVESSIRLQTPTGWRRINLGKMPMRIVAELLSALCSGLNIAHTPPEQDFDPVEHEVNVGKLVRALLPDKPDFLLIASILKSLEPENQTHDLELDLPARVPIVVTPQIQPTAPNN